jgi:hypothetical protein
MVATPTYCPRQVGKDACGFLGSTGLAAKLQASLKPASGRSVFAP